MDTQDNTEQRMPFWKHLEELRWVLLKCLIVMVISTTIGLTFSDHMLALLTWPVRDYVQSEETESPFPSLPPRPPDIGDLRVDDMLVDLEARVTLIEKELAVLRSCATDRREGRQIRMTYTSPIAPLIIRLKMGFLSGIAFAVPFVLYFVWTFLAPGLRVHERKVIRWGVVLGTMCFCVGAVFGYSFLPFGIPLLMEFGATGVEKFWPLQTYLSFCVHLILAFGLVFELPVVIGLLVRLGVLRVATLSRGRPYAVILALILAAVLTPPDVVSQVFLAVPILLLYEASIVTGRWQERKTSGAASRASGPE